MAIEAAHQTALKKDDKPDTWAINGATGFGRVDSAKYGHNRIAPKLTG
ncbi:hypothetical protein B738_16458 [Photorhabdus temperata subsp. temperata M1021]|nr:hypothetical protein B738_16458 [Photorhabdus temperata subsp. temperata M1021]